MVTVGDVSSYSYRLAEPGQAMVCQRKKDSPDLRVRITEVYFLFAQSRIVPTVSGCPASSFKVPSLLPLVTPTSQHVTSWLL